MHIYDTLGIKKYINAHDTYTVYGGSRISEQTLESMRQAAEYFVDMHELQKAVDARVADLTKNEDAFITNGAAGALKVAAAVCMTNGDRYRYSKLPAIVEGTKNEIIVLRCHRNAYDKALEETGAKIIEIGDADETLEYDLQGAINEKTAAIFFFENIAYRRAQMSLDKVISIAHSRGIPVVVDAAAQLPPRSNLWKYTSAGADMAIFSGGKTLRGPQDSGIIVGKSKYMDWCRMFGAPEHGVCRSSKSSRESMIGLLSALEQFMEKDEEQEYKALTSKLEILDGILSAVDGINTKYVNYGPVGQKYPRLYAYLKDTAAAGDLVKKMLEHGIYIGDDSANGAVYFSPLNLTESEIKIVGETVVAIVQRRI